MTNSRQNINESIGLLGDGDDLDLIVKLETAFNFRAEDSAYRTVETAGDLFALIWKHKEKSFVNGVKCATSMAFYRVRYALFSTKELTRISPSTLISELDDVTPGSVEVLLNWRFGLKADVAQSPSQFYLYSLLAFVLPIATALIGLPLWLCGLIAIPPIFFASRVPKVFRTDCQTVGDLARTVHTYNPGALAAGGARITRDEAWRCFRTICADQIGASADLIGPETRLFAVN